MSRDFFIKGAKQMKKGIRIVSVILAAVMMFIIADRIPAITDWFSAKNEAEKFSSDSSHDGILALVNNSHEYIDTNEKCVRLYDWKTDSFFLSTTEIYIDKRAVKPLCDMLDAFRNETGLKKINVISAERSVASQREIYNQKELKYGHLYTKKYVQSPGFSEHHTGLAVDLAIYNVEDGSSADFDGKGEYEWFLKNAHSFGFILRYPEEKESITGIDYEPWHFRFVGLPHSYYIEENGLCLEEYIELLQSKTEAKGLEISVGKKTYKVWHSKKEPKNCSFSGDNCGGYIVWKQLTGSR